MPKRLPTRNITPRFFYTVNTSGSSTMKVIIEVTNSQDKDKCGKVYGYKFESGQYRQRPDDELKGIFPYLEFHCKANKFDKDGNPLPDSAGKDEFEMWYYLDEYVQEGDKANTAVHSDDPETEERENETMPKLICSTNVHGDGCSYFVERFVKEWKEKAYALLKSGTNMKYIEATFPKYFIKSSFSMTVSREITLEQYKKKDEVTDNIPYVITNADYQKLTADEKAKYEEYKHDVTKTQTAEVTSVSWSESGYQDGLLFLDEQSVDKVLKPLAIEAGTNAADAVLANGLYEVMSFDFQEVSANASDAEENNG